MAKIAERQSDPVLERLDAIHATLETVAILQGARLGLNKADVRAMLGIGQDRITKVWKMIDVENGAGRGRHR